MFGQTVFEKGRLLVLFLLQVINGEQSVLRERESLTSRVQVSLWQVKFSGAFATNWRLPAFFECHSTKAKQAKPIGQCCCLTDIHWANWFANDICPPPTPYILDSTRCPDITQVFTRLTCMPLVHGQGQERGDFVTCSSPTLHSVSTWALTLAHSQLSSLFQVPAIIEAQKVKGVETHYFPKSHIVF